MRSAQISVFFSNSSFDVQLHKAYGQLLHTTLPALHPGPLEQPLNHGSVLCKQAELLSCTVVLDLSSRHEILHRLGCSGVPRADEHPCSLISSRRSDPQRSPRSPSVLQRGPLRRRLFTWMLTTATVFADVARPSFLLSLLTAQKTVCFACGRKDSNASLALPLDCTGTCGTQQLGLGSRSTSSLLTHSFLASSCSTSTVHLRAYFQDQFAVHGGTPARTFGHLSQHFGFTPTWRCQYRLRSNDSSLATAYHASIHTFSVTCSPSRRSHNASSPFAVTMKEGGEVNEGGAESG